MRLDRVVIRSLPKVLLHEHLDGVLRPKTIVELARSARYGQLPTEDPEELARWFHQGANQGSLPKYLEGFTHTIAVMQTEAALERVGELAQEPGQKGPSQVGRRHPPSPRNRQKPSSSKLSS